MNKLSLILVFLISFNLYGNGSLFVSANSDYAKQEYNAAIKKYNLILSSNLESPCNSPKENDSCKECSSCLLNMD